MTTEQIVGAVLLGLVLLFNLFARLLGSRREEVEVAEIHPERPPIPRAERKRGAASRRQPRRDATRGEFRHKAVSPRDRRTLRRAMVLMAVLGPCRGRAPYNPPE